MTRLDHLLWKVSEECNEVGKRASKAARFGISEVQPGKTETNAFRLVREYLDLQVSMTMLCDEDPRVRDAFAELFGGHPGYATQVRAKIEHFLEYSRQQGTLIDGKA